MKFGIPTYYDPMTYTFENGSERINFWATAHLASYFEKSVYEQLYAAK